MGVGDASGKVNVYDLRNPRPLYTVNHSYKLPIKKVKFHEHSGNIITVDKKLAKFSNMKTGKAFTNIETKYDINDFETFHDTGMFFVSLYINQLFSLAAKVKRLKCILFLGLDLLQNGVHS